MPMETRKMPALSAQTVIYQFMGNDNSTSDFQSQLETCVGLFLIQLVLLLFLLVPAHSSFYTLIDLVCSDSQNALHSQRFVACMESQP